MNTLKESSKQYRIVRWLRRKSILHCHVPNGGYRNRIEAIRLKQLGVEPGVPDLLIFDTPPLKPDSVGVALEIKRTTGSRTSDNQIRWLKELSDRGWETAVVTEAEQAITLLRMLGY